ncbi:MAG: iron-sulfur cluster assembly protein, partial [Bacteroidota bacterium]
METPVENDQNEKDKVEKDQVENELEQRIIGALKEIFDPEIPVNIYDLGLIYDINIYPDQTVHVSMTLTAPGCPVADTMPREVEESIRDVEGVTDARVELT